MLAFGLKLLGIGKSIGKFFMANWKIFVPILLVLAAWWYHNRAIDQAYDAGVVAEQQANQARVDEENRKNREFEEAMGRSIEKFGKKLLEDNEARIVTETIHTNQIKTIVQDNPVYEQCLVDQEVIDLRNQTRALGPRVEE